MTRPARHRHGVTLIELLIAMAVIGTLVVIAVPSYREQRMKAGRSIGASCLIEAHQRFEAHYATTHRGPPEIGLADVGLRERCGDEPTYQLRIDADSTCALHDTPGHYALRAIPTGEQARDGVLVLCISPSRSHPLQRADRQHLRPGTAEPLLAGWTFRPGR